MNSSHVPMPCQACAKALANAQTLCVGRCADTTPPPLAQVAMGRQLSEVGAAYTDELEAVEAALLLVRERGRVAHASVC